MLFWTWDPWHLPIRLSTKNILHRPKQEKNSQPVKFSWLAKTFLTSKKIFQPTKKLSTGQKILNPQEESWKINNNSQRVDLHLAWQNDIWAC